MKSTIATIAMTLGTLAAAGPGFAAPAKIGMAKARAIALKAAPGVVEKGEYEKEGGGWRYSFDIRQGKRIHEIGVDAFTGKIVESAYEALGARD